MIFGFFLTMPGVNSWDGKWSGAGNFYAVTRNVRNKKTIERLPGYYRYNFGGGWVAGIDVKQITSKESAKIKRKSDGFCGYEWMVDSIINHGQISAD